MTRLPDDQIDPYEPRLARRVDAFAEQGVRPIDAAAIAAAAHAGARRGTLAGRLFGSSASIARLGVVLAGALVAAVAFGVWIGAGGNVAPSQTAVPGATPTSVAGALDACLAADLGGQITTWEGAAGHRIATIDIQNTSSADCAVPALLRPALVDADGRALLVGTPVSDAVPVTLDAGGHATAMVDMANYCGAAPAAPLKIRVYLPNQTSVELAAPSKLPNPVDAPPCNGPNEAGTIQMQPLRLENGSK